MVNPLISIDDYRRRMGEMARMDIEDHVEECRQIGGGAMRAALEKIIDRTKLLSDQISAEFGVGSQDTRPAWLNRTNQEPPKHWPPHILDIMECQLTLPRSTYMAAIFEHSKLAPKHQPALDEPIRPMFVATRRAPKHHWAEISPEF